MMAGRNVKIDTGKFIDAWEKEECLWNVILNAYKDRNLRQAAIQKLANMFEVSGKYCSLCVYFSCEENTTLHNHFYYFIITSYRERHQVKNKQFKNILLSGA